MKALSIKQPWATLIASGIKDVENRTWSTNYRGRVLIHASGKKLPEDFEFFIYEWDAICFNNMLLGNLPLYPDMKNGYIIGYADLVDCKEGIDSIWAEKNCVHWKFTNAHLFDTPIPAKGKLNLWDYPDIDENNLPPAHKVELKKPHMEGKTFYMPVGEDDIDKIAQQYQYYLYLDEATCGGAIKINSLPVNPDNVTVSPIEKIVFYNGDKKLTRKIDTCVIDVFADDMEDGSLVEWKSDSVYTDELIEVPALLLYFE